MARFICKDTYYKRAKQEGYRARSAYKLLEMQQRFHVVKRENKVLDLGCAPGSWLQVLAELAGEKGLVLGIDILPVTPLGGTHVITRCADIRDLDVPGLLAEFGIGSFDVVTCDIAPNLSGVRDVDNANITDLYGAVKRVVERGLKKGGDFVLKSFFGEDLKGTVAGLSLLFSKVSLYKPAASRGVSSEVYLVCAGKK